MASSDALIRLIITASAKKAPAYGGAQAGHLPVGMRCWIALTPVAMPIVLAAGGRRGDCQLDRIDRQGLAR